MAAPSFDALWSAWTWRPIRDCPGRYVLSGAASDLTPAGLLGTDAVVGEHRVPGARDVVCVVEFDGGGLISYRREDGSYLHTLNAPHGLVRKLAQLGIPAVDGAAG